MEKKKLNFTIFSKANLGSVRVCYKDGQPWFVAKDVCNCLGLNNVSQACIDLLEDEKSAIILNDTRSKAGSTQAREMLVVSESGLYMLIMRSRKPEAKDFQRWVTREVLPSIRKNGGYIMGQENLPENEREKLLDQVQHLAKEVDAYKSDAELWTEMFFKAQEEYKALADNKKEVNEKTSEEEYVIDRNGFIIPKSLLADDKN